MSHGSTIYIIYFVKLFKPESPWGISVRVGARSTKAHIIATSWANQINLFCNNRNLTNQKENSSACTQIKILKSKYPTHPSALKSSHGGDLESLSIRSPFVFLFFFLINPDCAGIYCAMLYVVLCLFTFFNQFFIVKEWIEWCIYFFLFFNSQASFLLDMQEHSWKLKKSSAHKIFGQIDDWWAIKRNVSITKKTVYVLNDSELFI